MKKYLNDFGWIDATLVLGAAAGMIGASEIDTDSRQLPDYSALREPKHYSHSNSGDIYPEIEKARNQFYEASGIGTKDCEVCNSIGPEERKRLAELGEDFDVDPDVLMSIKYSESGGKQFGKDGKPVSSAKGASGSMQLMPIGIREAMDIFNRKRGTRHWSYLREFGDALDKYGDMVSPDYDTLRHFSDYHEPTNELLGAVNISFHKHKEGDLNEALKNYNTGENDKFRKPDAAQRYVNKITRNRRIFEEKCPKVWAADEAFRRKSLLAARQKR